MSSPCDRRATLRSGRGTEEAWSESLGGTVTTEGARARTLSRYVYSINMTARVPSSSAS